MSLDVWRVVSDANAEGYIKCQHDNNVLGFQRPSGEERELVRVWYRTGTVGTYLKHPRQGRTQMFRRGIGSHEEMRSILRNPRVHTGRGYHCTRGWIVPNPPSHALRAAGCTRARSVPCSTLSLGVALAARAQERPDVRPTRSPKAPGPTFSFSGLDTTMMTRMTPGAMTPGTRVTRTITSATRAGKRPKRSTAS